MQAPNEHLNWSTGAHARPLTWHGAAQDLGPHADAAPSVPGAGVDPDVAPHHRGREDVPHGDLLLPVASEDLLRQTRCGTLTSTIFTLQ